jgi:hypothetical protein
MARTCAYCGASGPLTGEHVVPAFLYRENPGQKLGFNEKARRFLEFEAIVRDVCETCNSGVLSALDTYGQQFVYENGCHRTFTKRHTVPILYDHNRLLRWLLKLSYNAMRFAGRDPGVLASSIGFVRGLMPLSLRAALFVEVVRDAVLEEELTYATPGGIGTTRRLSAKRFRFGEMKHVGQLPRGGQCRLVGLNAFYLYTVLLEDGADDRDWLMLTRALHEVAPQAVELSPRKRSVRVKVSKRTIVEAYEHQAAKDLPAWLEYLTQGGA